MYFRQKACRASARWERNHTLYTEIKPGCKKKKKKKKATEAEVPHMFTSFTNKNIVVKTIYMCIISCLIPLVVELTFLSLYS